MSAQKGVGLTDVENRAISRNRHGELCVSCSVECDLSFEPCSLSILYWCSSCEACDEGKEGGGCALHFDCVD